MTTEEKLLKMKEEIAQSREAKARFEGELQGLMNQLEARGVKSLEEAKAKIDELTELHKTTAASLEEQVDALLKAHDWGFMKEAS